MMSHDGDPRDEDLVAMVHVGKIILLHLTICYDEERQQYLVRIDDREIETTDTQEEAIRYSDVYLHGYMEGYDEGYTTTEDTGDIPHVHDFKITHLLKQHTRERRN